MSLFQFNLLALAISCALLVGGYSANRRKLGGLAMALGLIGLILVILNGVYVRADGAPIWTL